MLINVKMPKIVGILTFMSRIHFVLSVEHGKSFITSGPGSHVDSLLANVILPLQTVWIQIRPDKISGLIWIQTVDTDSVPQRIF